MCDNSGLDGVHRLDLETQLVEDEKDLERLENHRTEMFVLEPLKRTMLLEIRVGFQHENCITNLSLIPRLKPLTIFFLSQIVTSRLVNDHSFLVPVHLSGEWPG